MTWSRRPEHSRQVLLSESILHHMPPTLGPQVMTNFLCRRRHKHLCWFVTSQTKGKVLDLKSETAFTYDCSHWFTLHTSIKITTFGFLESLLAGSPVSCVCLRSQIGNFKHFLGFLPAKAEKLFILAMMQDTNNYCMFVSANNRTGFLYVIVPNCLRNVMILMFPACVPSQPTA